jgi:hypothetical protein
MKNQGDGAGWGCGSGRTDAHECENTHITVNNNIGYICVLVAVIVILVVLL